MEMWLLHIRYVLGRRIQRSHSNPSQTDRERFRAYTKIIANNLHNSAFIVGVALAASLRSRTKPSAAQVRPTRKGRDLRKREQTAKKAQKRKTRHGIAK